MNRKQFLQAVSGFLASLSVVGQEGIIRSERITLKTGGFDPDEITLPPGKVLLLLDNRSRLADSRIEFDQVQTGGALSRLKSYVSDRKTGLRFREVMDLPAGVFELSVPGKAGWKCRITVR